MKIFQWIEHLFYPPKCILCQKVLPIYQECPYICPSCAEKLEEVPLRICKSCGKPLDIAAFKPYCAYCAGEKHPFLYLVSPFYNRDEVKESIKRMKFGNQFSYTKTYAFYLYERVCQIPELAGVDAIVPAPISKKRLEKRGYNQTKLIASCLSGYMQKDVCELLVKTKETPPQSTLHAKDRKKNLEGSMEVVRQDPMPKSVLLVDDIYTTGATMDYCAKLLKQAGVSKVYAAAAAVSPPYFGSGEGDAF